MENGAEGERNGGSGNNSFVNIKGITEFTETMYTHNEEPVVEDQPESANGAVRRVCISKNIEPIIQDHNRDNMVSNNTTPDVNHSE